MIRFIPLLACCFLLSGCIWPNIERFEPVGGLVVHDNKTGTTHRRKLETNFIDADTKQPISDVDCILVLSRTAAYLPDSSGGRNKPPEIAVSNFNKLSSLTYTDRELYVWPFFAAGTLYSSANIFIYKGGYEPVEFRRLRGTSQFPKVIELRRCSSDTGKAQAIQMALAVISNEEWKNNAKANLERKLSSR